MAGNAEPAYVQKIKELFTCTTGPLYEGIKFHPKVESADLEETAKRDLKEFLQSAWDKLAGRCLAEWQKVSEKDGLLSSEQLRDQTYQDLFRPEDFKTELHMSQIIDERDDAEEAREAFKAAFFAPEVSKVALYKCGDDDVFSGVVIAAQRNQETILLFYYID